MTAATERRKQYLEIQEAALIAIITDDRPTQQEHDDALEELAFVQMCLVGLTQC